MPDVDLSKYGSVSEAEPDLSKYGNLSGGETQQPGPIKRFLEPMNPMPLVHRLFEPSGNHALDLSGYTLGKNVLKLVEDMGMAQVEEGKAAMEAFHKGDHTTAIARGLAALTPVLGPMSQQAADKFIAGDTAGGFGTLTAMALPEIIEGAPGAARGAGKVAKATVEKVKASIPEVPPIVGKVIDKATNRIPGAKIAKTIYRAAQDFQEARAEQAAEAAKAAPVEPAATPRPAPVRPPVTGPNPPPPEQPPAMPRTGPVQPPLKPGGKVRSATPEAVETVAPEAAAATPEAASPAAPVETARVGSVETPASTPTPKPALSPEAQAAAEALGDLGTSDLKPAEEFPAPEHYQSKAQVDKAKRVAEQLKQHGISSEDMALLEPEDPAWGMLFEGIGEKAPGKFSGDPRQTVAQTLLHLRELEKKSGSTSAPKAAPAAPVARDILPADESPIERPAESRAAGEGRPSEPVPGSGETGQGTRGETARGKETVIHVPGSDVQYPARYRVRELVDVQSSHSGSTFQPNPKYKLVNDRDYNQIENRGKVVTGSRPDKFKSAFHITDNPDATNGPIVVDSTGHALGGNGRKMILDRVYGDNGPAAASYRADLEGKAAQFGQDAEEIRGMKQPVLVREIADEHLVDDAARQRAITDFNVAGTASLTPAERAITDSRRVSSGTLDHIAGRLEAEGGNATLAKVLQGSSGTEVLGKLIEDGVIPAQERAAYESKGVLTKAGTQRISELMLGRFFRDPAQINNIAPMIKFKLERIAAPLAKVEGAGEWNLTPRIHEAMDILEESQKRGIANIDDLVKQSGLFGDQKFTPEGVKMAKLLAKSSAKQLVEATRQYAQDAEFAKRGQSLFGAPPSATEAFNTAFEKKPATKAAKPRASAIEAVLERAPADVAGMMKPRR